MARKTKAEAEATRSSLLDAAEHLFEQRGVARTSLQDIAQAAGVTRGAVYWHFSDKVDLFNAMMERVTLPLEELPPLPDQVADARAFRALIRLFDLKLRRLAEDAQVQRVYAIATMKVEYVEDFDAARQRHLRAISAFGELVQRHLQHAGLSAAAARRHAIGLHALMAGLIQTWMLAPDRFDVVKEGHFVLATYLAGIAAGLKTAETP